jgi:methionyl-tRNA synthetase
MAAGLELPGRVYAHGFVVVEGAKMSKSVGNVVLPEDIAARYGADALRYYLMREIPFWSDGSYSEEKLVGRFNHDLGNDLGNLVFRTLSMIERYFQGHIPPRPQGSLESWPPLDRSLRATSDEVNETLAGFMDALEFSRALDAIWEIVRLANRYVEESRPWTLAKDPAQRPRLEAVMYNLAEACRVLSVYLTPFMPATCAAMRRQFGLGAISHRLAEEARWGQSEPGTPISKGEPLFPRVE